MILTKRISNKISYLLKMFFDPQFRILQRWCRDNAESTLRYNYNLDSGSLVLDLGGYKGEFTEEIVNKYDCNVMVFEPVPKFAENIEERFKDNNKVSVYTYGLEDVDSSEILYLSDNASSAFLKNHDNGIEILYKDVEKFFLEKNITLVNLMKINIEGGEYALLEKMIKANLISRVENIQIQFHDIKELNSKKRMKNIWKELEKTHNITWQYKFVWENWERK